ncbi:NAD(P)-dependent oxidoreductase [Halomonas piscis]|uniref:NAD(P)-dependent oxidoreductase n=1 Tax=Halomonas piscis TaxID=3031727 RepID=A0ABY9YX16_9GAMM|nr:NAD(P)-dependent oxidoreductase [Halomonas piscis]WNK19424.1 NAD(P)-dependent oxidoreductase [Halomonas piscis]
MRPVSTVAFIGLGVMGGPIAGHLARQGFALRVYNRTRHKADTWVEQYGGSAHETPAAAAEGANLVLCCVGNDNDVREVTTGEQGALAGMSPGAFLVDHTTASADLALELADTCRQGDIGFLDAPVSGGQQGAESGALTIMCGGDQALFQHLEPVMAHYACAVTLMGPAGSGQLTKMVNQICVAGLVQSLSEGLHFARQSGLDAHRVMEVLSKGAAGSWQMENRHQTMLEGDYDHGFAVDWMRKDLHICLSEARRLNAALPITALVDQFYAELQRQSDGRRDITALLKRLQATE